jgi:Tfp pilus assembly protein PilX
MSAAGTKTRRKAENIIRNLHTEADKLKTNIEGLTGDKKAKAEEKLAKVLAAIAERTGKATAKAEANAARAAAKAEKNAEKEAAKAAAKAAANATKAPVIRATRRTKNEIAANLAQRAANAARKAAEARIAQAEKKAKAAEAAIVKKAKELEKNEKIAYKGLSKLFGNNNAFANNSKNKTKKRTHLTQFVKNIAQSYKHRGNTLKKGLTYVSAAAAFKKAHPSNYNAYTITPAEFNMNKVKAFINSYEPPKSTSESLRKKLEKTQEKCAEAIKNLEKQIAELPANE